MDGGSFLTTVKHMVASIVGVFGVIGLGLGVGALIFLEAVGAFDAGGDLGDAFAVLFALVGTFVFAVLVGLVVAAIGGHFAGHLAPTRQMAAASAAVGSAVGHVVLILVLAVTLTGGFALLEPEREPTGEETPDNEALAEDEGPVDWGKVGKWLLGAVPAALVGATSAWLFYVDTSNPWGSMTLDHIPEVA